MLRWDVVHAAQAGQFHIYAVSSVDDAMELLTGMEAGTSDAQGHFRRLQSTAKSKPALAIHHNKKEYIGKSEINSHLESGS